MHLIPLGDYIGANPNMIGVVAGLYVQTAPYGLLTIPPTAAMAVAKSNLQNASSHYLAVLEDDKLIGIVGAERFSPIDGTAEPVIAIVPEFRRQGKGLEAAKLGIRTAVEALDIRRLQVFVIEASPSVSLLKRLNFEHEATLKRARFYKGEYVDVLVFAWEEGE